MVEVFLFSEKVELLKVHILFLALEEGTRVDDHVTLIIDYGVQLLCRHSEQISNLIGQAAEIPDVSYGHYQLNVSAALATHLLLGDFDTATVAHDTLIADTLVLAAVALVVLGRTKDALAEQAVALGLISAVVDGLRLQNLAE